MKSLNDLLEGIAPEISDDQGVTGLSLDSRLVRPGMVFIALRGLQEHGLNYAVSAVQAGAVAILFEPDEAVIIPALPKDVPVLPVPDLSRHLGLMANRFNDYPSSQMAMIGVTGTDGKTSVSHFIAQAMCAIEYRWAVIGTVGMGIPNALQAATHTTPDVLTLQRCLRQFQTSVIQGVAMEVSSHALDQGRVDGIAFDTAVLTNLGRDHLDYHLTVESYTAAKQRLFVWPGLKNAVLNLDDAFGRQLAQQLEGSKTLVMGYGVGSLANYPENTIVAEQVSFSLQGIQATVFVKGKPVQLVSPVLGAFNLHNMLATLCVLLLHDLPLERALTALSHIQTVPGRMERVSAKDNEILVVVDYAHTADALSSALQALRRHTQERLLCVFGCGGDRDRGKRPLMAQAAEEYADQIFVTDDNPRNEQPGQILTDIRNGFKQLGGIYFTHDRALAIQQAINAAKPGDAVLIAGKGHETVQLKQGQAIHFDDRIQAKQALERRRLV